MGLVRSGKAIGFVSTYKILSLLTYSRPIFLLSTSLTRHCYVNVIPIVQKQIVIDKEEIFQEAAIQNIPSFSEFLRVAAITSGELLNYANVAGETGLNAKVARQYFQILEDTLLGFRLQPQI